MNPRVLLFAVVVLSVAASAAETDDPNLWLEDITGDKPMAWVKEHNAKSTAELTADPSFEPLRKRLLSILDSKDKIPYPDKEGRWFYNFWRDEQHPKGLWRRLPSLAEYEKPQPQWETVIDVDALAKAENESWVWRGAMCLLPKSERCLVRLSKGGADAVVTREFDVVKKAFVPDGFTLPEGRTFVSWKDRDTLIVGGNFGPGSMTDAGYPRYIKQWKRGTPLEKAVTLFEVPQTDVGIGVDTSWSAGKYGHLIWQRRRFLAWDWQLRVGDKWVKLDLPQTTEVSQWSDQLLLAPLDDWSVGGKVWPKGSFLAIGIKDFLEGKRDFTVLFEPSKNRSLDAYYGVVGLKHGLILQELEDVHTQLSLWTRNAGKWVKTSLPNPGLATQSVRSFDGEDSDEFWIDSTGFIQPYVLELAAIGKAPRKLNEAPAFFDAKALVVEQHFATSKDGTRVPYFQVSRKDLKLDGQSPTLLTGYGGFKYSLEPYYDALAGAAWLERGGVYVSANIRGGGEYGPQWHEDAQKTKRQNAYDDLIAVAEDLVKRKVTSPKKLGVRGGSNGGLLVGVMLTERPDLFGAVVADVPLLDMKRYHRLLSGATWLDEYGDPDKPDEWAAMAKYSPYQNVKKGVKYPRVLFTSSTRDDRMHPAHARKMVAKMESFGDDVLYYENVEGGHGGAADNQQRAFMNALAYTFLGKQLGLPPIDDENLWLEDITGEKPLAWVKEHNAKSTAELGQDPSFEPLRKRLKSILDSKDKIPYADKRGKWFYNFWRDEQHPKGVWRRVASLAEYQKPSPKWETVLDVDALAKAEKQSWVWKGADCLYPAEERCLISLSHGGADAEVVREFDVVKKAFVPGGFTVPETKSSTFWKDLDTLYVSADFGPDSFTDAGYPRIVKEWKRGTPLGAAMVIHTAPKTSMKTGALRRWDHGHVYDLLWDRVSFYAIEWSLRQGDQWVRIEAPKSADLDTWDGQLLLHLREDWTVGGKTWPKDSLLATDLDAFLKGGRDFTALFEPAPNRSLNGWALLKTAIITTELEDVRSKLSVWTHEGGKWTRAELPTSGLATYGAWPVERYDSDQYWLSSEGFTQPDTLELGAIGKPPEKLKSSPAFFDASQLVVEQHFTKSKDGTQVPYFQISRKDLKLDGQNPTLLYGYGGFEISLLPAYDPLVGASWLEKGGVLVIANTRGGSEYGPRWHQAGLKTKRQVIYDDMIAVAEELIARKVTSTPKLGIHGASNGGLLMGVMLVERPDLFGAIVGGVPLLDMKRYPLMLAGASWVEEYGDPNNPEEWAALSKFSPYQNVKKGVKYPRTLFYTSTRDDRVHPAHARKMVARMEAQGHDVLYYENVEGGHAGAADNEQKAFMMALTYTFLSRQVGLAH